MVSNKIKFRKSVWLLNTGAFLVIGAIILSAFILREITRNKIKYVHSSEIIALNNDLDRLFKDIVYLPLIVDSQSVTSIELQKMEDINSKLLHLKSLVENQFPNITLVQDMEQNWNLLKNAASPEKLNILYDLELIHNAIDRQETDQMNLRINSGTANTVLLSLFAIVSGLLGLGLIFMSKKFEKKELIQLQTQLEKAKKSTQSMSAFLAVAGHELRTPLNGIIGLSEILRKSRLPEEETHYADNLYHSGKALLKIINNLLEFSRIESGKIELENAEFSLGAVIQQIITTFRTNAREKNIKFTYLIDEEVPERIYGDSSRLSQILFNLVGNAITYTMNGTVILKVKVLSKGPLDNLRLFFSVEDTGIGLSEEQLKKLFLPFNQIQLSGKIGEIYPGLSFAICNQLVQAMGGEFEVRSKQGLGSSFSFTATFSKFSEEKLGRDFLKKYHYFDEHEAIEPIFDKEDKPIVLVVDDNPANLLMAQVMLERLGAKVVTATNGKEALNEFPRSKVDLILMDCQMPVMDGYEATKMLRQSNVRVPILAMTATTTLEEQGKCFKSGMNSFIAKPLEIDTLVVELKKALYLEPSSLSEEVLEKLEASIGYQGMSKVVQAFIDDLPVTEESIDQSLKKNDLAEIHKIGHRVKSSSQAIGAKGLANLFLKLEKTEDIEKVYDLKKQIHTASVDLKNKLSERIVQLH